MNIRRSTDYTNTNSMNSIPRLNEETNTEDINRFLNDHDVRRRLLNINDNINIREASQLYNKKKNKFNFELRVILLSKRGDRNVIPKEGTLE